MLLWTQQNKKFAKFVGKNFLLRMTNSRKFTHGRRKEPTLVLSSFPCKGCSSGMIRNAEWNIDGGHINIPSIIFQSVFFEHVCPFHKNTDLSKIPLKRSGCNFYILQDFQGKHSSRSPNRFFHFPDLHLQHVITFSREISKIVMWAKQKPVFFGYIGDYTGILPYFT